MRGWPSSPRDPFRYGFYKEMVTGPPGFEPGFEAPEAPVMSKLYYGPTRPRWNGPPSYGLRAPRVGSAGFHPGCCPAQRRR